jgi:hypothetical protein
MPFIAGPISLTSEERAELEEITKSRTLPAGDVFRARLIMILADGFPYRTIKERLDTKRRPSQTGEAGSKNNVLLACWRSSIPGQKATVITPARVLELRDGSQ